MYANLVNLVNYKNQVNDDMYKKLCFNFFVIEKKDVVVGMKVGESVKRMLDRIADDTDRTISYVARELMIRGLALYQADGQLKDDLNRTTERHLAPVVARIAPANERRDAQRMIDEADSALKTGMPLSKTGSAITADKMTTKHKRRTG